MDENENTPQYPEIFDCQTGVFDIENRHGSDQCNGTELHID